MYVFWGKYAAAARIMSDFTTAPPARSALHRSLASGKDTNGAALGCVCFLCCLMVGGVTDSLVGDQLCWERNLMKHAYSSLFAWFMRSQLSVPRVRRVWLVEDLAPLRPPDLHCTMPVTPPITVAFRPRKIRRMAGKWICHKHYNPCVLLFTGHILQPAAPGYMLHESVMVAIASPYLVRPGELNRNSQEAATTWQLAMCSTHSGFLLQL